jgi:hypothetical protein
MRKLARGVALLALTAAVLVVAGAASADTATVHVTPATTHWVRDDVVAGGQVSWSAAVGAPTGLGSSSLELTTDATVQAKADLFNHDIAGMALADVTKLGYSTYQRSASFAYGDASFQLQLLVDGASGFTTLVFEPYNGHPANGTVTNGEWQHWDVSAGQFWSTRTVGNLQAGAGGTSFYTLAQVKALEPNAVVIGVGVDVGSNNPGYDVFVDGLQVNDTTYDFETSGCETSTSDTTITLLDDCTETGPFTVPDGFTLDGGGHTLTAADPAGGAFIGAAVQNGGSSMNVTNLTIEGASTAVNCEKFTGVDFANAGGSVTNTTVDRLLRDDPAARGCQNGLGIHVNSDDGQPTREITITGNTVTDYNKNGITVNGPMVATISGNVVTGSGPVPFGFAGQNGIQVGFGASALVTGNTVSGNDYLPESDVACGVLVYQANGVRQNRNDLFDNEQDFCNFGRGGGKVGGSPASG